MQVKNKRLIFSALLLLACVSGIAQTYKFEVKHKGNILKNNAVIEVNEHYFDGIEEVMTFDVEVTNISSSEYSMKLEKKIINVQPGSENKICWAECAPPEEMFVLSGEEMKTGEIDTRPYGVLVVKNVSGVESTPGVSTIHYTFRTNQKGDATLLVKVNYNYQPMSSTRETKLSNELEIVVIDGSVQVKSPQETMLTITCANGTLVRQQRMLAGETIIADLPRGFYIINGTKVII